MARTGGIEYAEQRMAYYKVEAEKVLSIFPGNEIRQALLNLLEFTIQRKK